MTLKLNCEKWVRSKEQTAENIDGWSAAFKLVRRSHPGQSWGRRAKHSRKTNKPNKADKVGPDMILVKQIAQYQDGRLEMQEVPCPSPPPGGVLVRTTHSVISIGTEKMKIEQAKMNLLQKARARPDQVRKVLDTARTLGWRSAMEKVRNRLESPTPLGYSTAGVVVEVDSANTRFRVGDRVACAGAECAFHAEYLAVPDLLLARIPEEVESWKAAYTTICAIALHAVRQLTPNL